MDKINIIFFLSLILLPTEYGYQDCQEIAETIQKEHGGKMIFLIPLQSNGAYEIGEYVGHWMNRIDHTGKSFFIDYKSQSIFTSKSDVLSWMQEITGKKYELWTLQEENIPFSIIYH